MTGFNSKREATANKLQEPVNLLEARKIAAEYGTPDSQVDDGNLYFALSKCLEHIDTQPAQEPVREALKLALEALESSWVFVTTREKIKHPEGTKWYDERITAIKEALAQPAQEKNT